MKPELLLALFVAAQQQPLPATTPPAPSQVQGVCPTNPPNYLPNDPEPSWGAQFNMNVETHTPSWFLPEQLGCPVESFDRVECYGHIRPEAHLRYFIDGTSPTALAGTVAPQVLVPGQVPMSPEGTLDGADRFFIHTPWQLKGFKVIAVSQRTVIQWTCQRGL